MFMGEKFGRDSIWENHLAREIWLTSVELEAVLEEQTVSLRDMLGLQVGSTIRLNAPSEPKGQPALRPGADGQRSDRPLRRPAGDQGRARHRAADGAAP